MEPLSALSAVGAVSSCLQVVDFGAKVAFQTYRLLNAPYDTLRENIEVEGLIRGYDSIAQDLTDPQKQRRPLTAEETDLSELAEQCKAESKALLDLLQDLKRLDAINGQLAVRLLQLQGHSQTKRHEEVLSSVHENGREAVDAVLRSRDAIVDTVEQQSKYFNATYGYRKRAEVDQAVGESSGTNQSHLSDVQFLQLLETGGPLDRDLLTPKQRVRYDSIKARQITESLVFSEMKLRKNAIPPAYKQTYEWVLTPTSSFASWLQRTDGVFWICGRAASGKSTLVKFIVDHCKTRQLLQSWSGDSHTCLADFYFWYAGTTMQKSIQGLLQSILYAVFMSNPELVQTICPMRWNSYEDFRRFPDNWSEDELYQSIDALSRLDCGAGRDSSAKTSDQVGHQQPAVEGNNHDLVSNSLTGQRDSIVKRKFCIFIDGLDEYRGNHMQLAEYLKKLGENPHFKICVSSRPWHAFTHVFEDVNNRIQLEDLTLGDISAYVNGKLDPVRRSDHLDRSYRVGQSFDQLQASIISKAHGVFIWVYIVVESVLRGYSEGDSIATLCRRVDAFPDDLEDFFHAILARVDPFYSRQTAQALYLAMKMSSEPDVAGRGAWSFLSFWLLQDGQGDLEYILQRKEKLPCSVSDLANMKAETVKYLSACSKDLLHPVRPKFAPGEGWVCCITQYRVEVFHRTVYDFIRSCLPDLFMKHVSKCFEDDTFWSCLTLARLCIIPSSVPASEANILCDYFHIESVQVCKALKFGIDSKKKAAFVWDLDELGHHYLTNCSHYMKEDQSISSSAYLHGQFAAYQTGHPYPEKPMCSIHLIAADAPALYNSLGLATKCTGRFTMHDVDMDILYSDLVSGECPNEFVKQAGATVWQCFIEGWYQLRSSLRTKLGRGGRAMPVPTSPLDDTNLWIITKMMIQHGANLQQPIRHMFTQHSTPAQKIHKNGTHTHEDRRPAYEELQDLVPTIYLPELYEILDPSNSWDDAETPSGSQFSDSEES